VTRLALALALFAAACKRERPPPRYCDQDLSGVWVNSSDTSYAYRLTDEREVVKGKFFSRAPDGGEAAASGSEPILIELRRSESALAGVMKSSGESPSGRKCKIEFALQISSCQPAAMQVVAETQVGVRDDCSRARDADGGQTAVLVEYRWERPPAR
jgi:hypothetical protein